MVNAKLPLVAYFPKCVSKEGLRFEEFVEIVRLPFNSKRKYILCELRKLNADQTRTY